MSDELTVYIIFFCASYSVLGGGSALFVIFSGMFTRTKYHYCGGGEETVNWEYPKYQLYYAKVRSELDYLYCLSKDNARCRAW